MKRIYLDHAAATPLDAAAQKAFNKALDIIGNPSSYNNDGREAADALHKARQRVAKFLSARPEEIIFTSSGSEANALALSGILSDVKQPRVITTPIEHVSVLQSLKSLVPKKELVFAKVNEGGMIDIEDFTRTINHSTRLVSVMYANNEIGTIQPIQKIGKIIQEFRKKNNTKFPLFHVDACQAGEYLDMNVQHLGVDLLTFNSSKLYGPRGVGVLYLRRGIALHPLVQGGGQEHGLRAGTENVAAIVGLAAALDTISFSEGKRLTTLRDGFFEQLPNVLGDIKINGALGADRLPNNINISIPGLDSENLLLELDAVGISAGSGSACTARSVEPSHVLQAIGVRKPYLDGALRFSLGRSTTKKDIDYLLIALPKIVARLHRRYR